MQAAVAVCPRIPRSAPFTRLRLQLVTSMNLFGTVYSCNTVTPIIKQ